MFSNQRLVILDADGTIIDAFRAIEKTFAHHGMDIGPVARFQKRRNLFKYLGGIKEMPVNLRRQFRGMKRSTLRQDPDRGVPRRSGHVRRYGATDAATGGGAWR